MKIGEQIKELRECIEECDNPLYNLKMKRMAKLMGRAAETIESLFIKLQAVNMEQSGTGKKLTSFLCNRKREYQKRCDRAYEQEKQARRFLEDEPDREDLKSRLNYAIKLQDRYSTLIDFIEELQKAPIAYDVDEVIGRLEERATDNRRMALLSENKEFTYREDEDMKAIEIIKVEMRG